MPKTYKVKGAVLNRDSSLLKEQTEYAYDANIDSKPGKNTKTEIVLNPFKLYIKRWIIWKKQ